MSRGFFILFVAIIVAGSAVPAACAAGQESPFQVDAFRTVVQVQTDDAVLGRITYVDPGGSAYICREVHIITPVVGETLLHGDIISLPRGQSIQLQMVDRSEETVLDGGVDGVTVFIEKCSGTGGGGYLSGVVERFLPESVKPSWRYISAILDDLLAGIGSYLDNGGSGIPGSDTNMEEIRTGIEVFR